MNPTCSRATEHLSRRALMKGALATAAGGVVMNWGGLDRHVRAGRPRPASRRSTASCCG